MNYPKGGFVDHERRAAGWVRHQKQIIDQLKAIPEKSAQIVIVAGYDVFIELAEMLKYSLLELGLDKVDIYDSADVKPILYHISIIIRAFRKYTSWALPGYKILFQTEECWNDRKRGVYRYELLEGVHRILEMYDENCKLGNTQKVHYCPVGYSPVWEHNLPKVDEDIDILFHGSITPRRKKFLDELSKKYNVMATSDTFGDKRAELINRSKIVLNIKANDKWSFGPLHCLPAMANKKFMLAEKANGGYGPFKPQFHFKEYNGLHGKKGLLDAVKYWINAGREARDEFAEHAHKWMKVECDFTKIVKNAMGDLL